MILVDTGPLVAIFDPRDADHAQMVSRVKSVRPPLVTTTPVLTEAFHLLSPASKGSSSLREFLRRDGLQVWFLSQQSVDRALELMEQYGDNPMDFADASLVAAAEALRTTSILTLDRADFSSYRARIGRGHRAFRQL